MPHPAEGVLDIFHAVEHISETSRALYGEGTAEAKQWLDAGRSVILAEGEPGLQRQIAETMKQVRSPKKRASLESLSGYFANHSHHMNYAVRLLKGRSIGTGQIKGACKNLIGRRLKQTGARWKVRRVNRMAIHFQSYRTRILFFCGKLALKPALNCHLVVLDTPFWFNIVHLLGVRITCSGFVKMASMRVPVYFILLSSIAGTATNADLSFGDEAPAVTVGAIRAAVADRVSRVESFRGMFRIRQFPNGLPSQLSDVRNRIYSSVGLEYRVSGDRERIRLFVANAPTDTPRLSQVECFSNGTTTQVIYRDDGETIHTASKTSGRLPDFGTRSQVKLFMGRALPPAMKTMLTTQTILDVAGGRASRDSEHPNLDVFEADVPDGKGGMLGLKVCYDRDAGWLPVRMSTAISSGKTGSPAELTHFRVTSIQKVRDERDGSYLDMPLVAEIEGSVSGARQVTSAITSEEFRLNPVIPESDFVIELPSGTVVDHFSASGGLPEKRIVGGGSALETAMIESNAVVEAEIAKLAVAGQTFEGRHSHSHWLRNAIVISVLCVLASFVVRRRGL